MSLESRPSNSLFKRKEQLKRWEDSETNRESAELPADKALKIKFSDGCVFLAACAAGDTAEVARLLAAGADINTTNVDGLTALHQACIDDNMAMVEFLVEHGCDLNLGDNEGWTPLHATASCGFVSVARYLIENGADVSRVNNDGDLPIDIAESEEMEELLQAEVDRLNVDCEAARNEEERLMLEDAKQMLNNSRVQDKVHPRTGATSLHVAAAKGYLKVMSLLIQAGVDLNAQDVDGWTPLHAAAHWGQKGACRLLCEALANMALPNYVGQTCFDLADPDVLPVLEELRKKQDSMQKERPEIQEILERKAQQRPSVLPHPPPLKRRTSVTRMSLADKNSVVVKDTSAERSAIEAQLLLAKVDEEAERKSEEREIRLHPSSLEERQVARKNEVNRAVSNAYAADNRSSSREGEEEQEEEVTVALRRLRRPSPSDSRIAAEPVSAEVTVAHPGLAPRSGAESPPVVVATITIDEKKKEPSPPTDVVTLRKPLRVNTDVAVTEVTTSAPSTPPSAESITKRTFVMPVRDEESETQRKAHAKRVRETRRSTQGVTLEDVKSAEQQLLKRQQELEDRKEDKPPPVTTTATAAPTTTATTTTTTTTTTTAEELVRRHSWRNRDKEEEAVPPAVRVVPSSPEGTPTVTLSMPRPRGQRVIGSAATDVSHTVTVPVRPRAGDDTGVREGGAGDGDREDSKTNAAISRRRRPKRRSTGVVYLDDSAGGQESLLQDQEALDREKLRIGGVNDLPNNAESAPDTVRGRSGSAGSLADSTKSETESRLSSSAASLQDDDELDYKKLYTELKEDYDRLKGKLSRTEDELDTTRRQLEKAQLNNRNSLSDAEKRERRALERKISEMEEELKQSEQLRAENVRIREENGALIRVISKLSK